MLARIAAAIGAITIALIATLTIFFLASGPVRDLSTAGWLHAQLALCALTGIALGVAFVMGLRARRLGLEVAAIGRRLAPALGVALVGVVGASGLNLASRATWSRAQTAWDNPETRERADAMITALWYEQVTGEAASSFVISHGSDQVWAHAQPAHLAALTAPQRALVLAQTTQHIKRDCGSNPGLRSRYWHAGDCLRAMPGIARVLPSTVPLLRTRAVEIARADLADRKLPDVLSRARALQGLEAFGLSAVLLEAIDAHLKAARDTEDLGDRLGRLDALVAQLDPIPEHALKIAPALKDRLDDTRAAARALRTRPILGQPLSLLHARDPQRTPGDPLNATTQVREDAAGALPALIVQHDAAQRVRAVIMLPRHTGTTRQDVGEQLAAIAGLPARTAPTALTPQGWAFVGDPSLEDQLSALAWLADRQGKRAHDAALAQRLEAERREADRREAARREVARREAARREAARREGPTLDVIVPLGTHARPASSGYGSGVMPSTSTSTSTSTYRPGAPSAGTGTSASTSTPSTKTFRSGASGYRSRYNASSRSASSAGGFRSGK